VTTFFVSQHLISLHLEQFILDCKARRLSPTTLRFYAFEISRFLKWGLANNIIDIAQFKPSTIRAWMIYQQEEQRISDVSIGTNFRAIRRFFNWLESEGEIDKAQSKR
jgi:site-specific recombinase XerD